MPERPLAALKPLLPLTRQERRAMERQANKLRKSFKKESYDQSGSN